MHVLDTNDKYVVSSGIGMVPFYMNDSLVMWIGTCPGFRSMLSSWEDLNLGEFFAYEALKTHHWRTRDANRAHLFYIPLWEFASFKVGTCRNTTHADRMNAFAASLISTEHWKRKNGSDHFFITTAYSYGSHSLRARLGRNLSTALHNGIVGRYKNALPLASRVAERAFSVPYPIHYGTVQSQRSRTHLVYFGGTLDVCCTGKRIRCAMTQLAHTRDVHIVPTRRESGPGPCTSEYINRTKKEVRYVTTDLIRSDERLMQSSIFCLTPAGDNCISGRFYNALANGCIPVAICPGARMKIAFEQRIPYKQMMFLIDEKSFVRNASNLIARLNRVSIGEIRRMQNAISANLPQIMYDAEGATNVLSEASKLLR